MYAAMRALWASPLSRSEHVRIAQPLAFVPELGLVVESAVPEERNLKEALCAALRSASTEDVSVLEATLRMTARGLADVHRCGARHGDSVTWADESATLRTKHPKLAAVVPHRRSWCRARPTRDRRPGGAT